MLILILLARHTHTPQTKEGSGPPLQSLSSYLLNSSLQTPWKCARGPCSCGASGVQKIRQECSCNFWMPQRLHEGNAFSFNFQRLWMCCCITKNDMSCHRLATTALEIHMARSLLVSTKPLTLGFGLRPVQGAFGAVFYCYDHSSSSLTVLFCAFNCFHVCNPESTEVDNSNKFKIITQTWFKLFGKKDKNNLKHTNAKRKAHLTEHS